MTPNTFILNLESGIWNSFRTLSVIMVCLLLSLHSDAQSPAFKVLAFYSTKVEPDHVDFAKDLRAFYTRLADENNFTVDVTRDWTNLNDTLLKNYNVVMWINDFPHSERQRRSFEKFMNNGGSWIGFHVSGYNDKTTNWPWFVDFMGGGVFYINSWPPIQARLIVDDTGHDVTRHLTPAFGAPVNEWYQWKPSPRENKNVKVLVTLDPLNYPLGIKDIIPGGDTPVVWTNTKYRMIYLNMGHGDLVMTSDMQNNMIADALMWVGKTIVVTSGNPPSTDQEYPEMITVPGGTYTMGDDTGEKDEKPAHTVKVNTFRIARTETTVAQWRMFCNATHRPMPEAPWFGLKDNHPIVNISYDDAVAYCHWLSSSTGRRFRLPTEAEWEYAARGGNKSKGYPYSGAQQPDSIAWYSGTKTNGTMPVAQRRPNELGLYDMTGNVWEWCSDGYDGAYYAQSRKDDPRGAEKGVFYTLRGGAWDIGARNSRNTYRNPLAPTSRNHNKGLRIACSD